MVLEQQATALVVDDNDAMRYAVGRMLRDAGFNVLEASNGHDALHLATSAPDVILLDINLPDISGVEVCKRIKTNPQTCSIPVVHLSGQSTDLLAQTRGLSAGADAYLSQPIPKHELVGTIHALLRTRSASPQRVEHQPEVRRLLAALREKNQVMASLARACPLAVIAIDGSNIVTAWNPAAERMFGWSETEALGRPIAYVPEDARQEFEWLNGKNDDNKVIIGHETRRLRKDGRTIDVSLSRAPLFDTEGKINGCIVVAEDITYRKRSERILIHNEKLVLTSQLAASLAHQINNPLESISNALYLLRQTIDQNGDGPAYLGIAEAELQRVIAMTQCALGFSRSPEPNGQVDVCRLMDDVLEMYSRQLEVSGIRVSKRYAAEPVVIFGNASELRQVFANLVGNAIQAMTSGGALTVHVRAKRNSPQDPRPCVRVFILDSGPGMPLSVRTRIFEPFFTTKGDKGTGLGLWVVQRILHHHQASIQVRSSMSPGRSGTCFRICLPPAVAPPAASE